MVTGPDSAEIIPAIVRPSIRTTRRCAAGWGLLQFGLLVRILAGARAGQFGGINGRVRCTCVCCVDANARLGDCLAKQEGSPGNKRVV